MRQTPVLHPEPTFVVAERIGLAIWEVDLALRVAAVIVVGVLPACGSPACPHAGRVNLRDAELPLVL